jgi:hypothetical protein
VHARRGPAEQQLRITGCPSTLRVSSNAANPAPRAVPDHTLTPTTNTPQPTPHPLPPPPQVIPLVGGVDITPIVWVGLLSFFNEILLGPQGILMLIQRQSGAGL